MLAFPTKRTVKNIFIITHNFYIESIFNTLLQLTLLNQVEVVDYLDIVVYSLFSTTLSINPKSFALSGVMKLSLSRADLISSTDFPVCLE